MAFSESTITIKLDEGVKESIDKLSRSVVELQGSINRGRYHKFPDGSTLGVQVAGVDFPVDDKGVAVPTPIADELRPFGREFFHGAFRELVRMVGDVEAECAKLQSALMHLSGNATWTAEKKIVKCNPRYIEEALKKAGML
ncbi:hypothetical protein OAF54_01095 [bacterium]|nr:hypothetical protein [bacterium]